MRVEWHEVNGRRVVEVTRPEDAPDGPLPVVLSIHGRSDRPHVPDAPFYGIRGPFRYLAPEGTRRLGEGFSWFPVRVAESRDDALAESLAEEVARLVDVLDALDRRRPRVGGLVVTGFSQGALMTLGLVALRPDLVSTALPTAGWLPPSWAERAAATAWPPIRALHGEDDDAVPVGPARALYRRLETLGVDVELQTHPGVGHTMDAAMHAQKARWLAEAVERVRAAAISRV